MPRTPTATKLSITDIERLIQDRWHALNKLVRKRAKIQKKADRLDRQIAALGGTVSGGGRGRRGGASGARAKNEANLSDTIAKVLEQAVVPLGIADVTEKVLASGYHTNSGNFRSVVSLNLIKDKKRFENVGRGVYQLRNGAAGKAHGEGEKLRKKRKATRKSQKAGKGGRKRVNDGSEEGREGKN